MVADEVQPFAQPHRAADVALQAGQARELSAFGGRFHPQMARAAAAVAFPARRVGGVAADHARAAGAGGEVVHRPERQPFGALPATTG